MCDMETIVQELCNDAQLDINSLPYVVGQVQYGLNISNEDEIRNSTMIVVRKLMTYNIWPGDLENKSQLSFWVGTPDDLIFRIDKEWTALGRLPDLGNYICWFGLR